MGEIEKLIDDLRNELMTAKKAAFSPNAVIVDRAEMLQKLNSLQSQLPLVIGEAKSIKRDRQTIMEQADMYANEKIQNAAKQVQYMVAESEIVAQAKAEAEKILQNANANYEKIDYEARCLAFQTFEESEKAIQYALGSLKECKKSLSKTKQ